MKYERIAIAAALVAGIGCATRSEDAPATEESRQEMLGGEAGRNAYMPVDSKTEMGEEEPDDKAGGKGRGAYAQTSAEQFTPGADRDEHKDLGEAGVMAPASSETAVQTRSWFPETFLFEPLVVTDEQGRGSVEVLVPDRLTTWRVLALAHSRGGSQAGATTRFVGTLPTYVDPIVPPRLRAGDRVRIPVQAVNTTLSPVSAALKIQTDGADLSGPANQNVSIPAGGSALRTVELSATRPGTARVLARLGDADAVVKSIEVVPTGRPIAQENSGTLAEPRSFELTGATAATPGTGRVRLMVFPGALSILRTELSVASGRRGLEDDAFALLLSGRAPALLSALGETPETDELRELSIVLAQRVVRHARTLDVSSATLLAEAALSHPDNPILSNIGQRAVQYLESGQRPDGTCGGEDGWSLQRLLVATAECARAASTETHVVIRASGAFERHAEHIRDPYTAAAILASGAVSGNLAEALRAKVKEAITDREDASKIIAVPDGVVRSDGSRPSDIEATAFAVLALAGEKDIPLADLGASILAGYSPRWGWGDGRANLVATQAIVELFKDPIPDNVKITLRMDGEIIAEGTLSRDKVKTMLVLENHGIASSGAHQWSVQAEPAVPGLGYSLSVTDWVKWPDAPQTQGVELIVTPPGQPKVGRANTLRVQANAPSGESIAITLALPAGVQVDQPSLEAMQHDGTLASYEIDDDQLQLTFAALEPAKLLDASIRVIPTLAGSLQSGASTMKVAGVTVNRPPTMWRIQ